MAIKLGHIIVDGMFFDNLPSTLLQIVDEDYGVRNDSHITLHNKRIVVTESATMSVPDTYRYKRKIHQQAWSVGWDMTSPASSQLRDLLAELYETQRCFWIQMDDEMSRNWGRCLTVGNDIYDTLSPHAFFTPTYPIFPYGHEPGDSVDDWTDMLMVEGQLWNKPFTVDSETGLVLIQPDRTQFTHRTKVLLKYTWRAYVRIASMELSANTLAQTLYNGSVQLEQVPIPTMGAELTWRSAPYTRSCVYYSNSSKITANASVYVVARSFVANVKRGSGKAIVLCTGCAKATKNVSGVHSGSGTALVTINGAALAGSIGQSYQIIRPDGDTNTMWSIINGTSRYGTIDDVVLDTTDGITGGSAMQTGTFTDAYDPGVDTNFSITVTWERLHAISTGLMVSIYCGALQVASGVFNASSDGIRTDTYTLTTTQASSITDFTKLTWEVSSGAVAAIYNLYMQIPTSGGKTYRYGGGVGTIVVSGMADTSDSVAMAVGSGVVRVVASAIAYKMEMPV